MRRPPALLLLVPFLALLGPGLPPGHAPRAVLLDLDDDDEAAEAARAARFRESGLRIEPPTAQQEARTWWHRQRAYPSADIPAGAYDRGRAAFHALRRVGPRLGAAKHEPKPPPPDPGGTSSWQSLGPAPVETTEPIYGTPNMSPAAGRAAALAIDPTDSNVLYAGYGLGGVWKTTNAGKTWKPLSDLEPTLAVGSVTIDPAAPQTLYVGTGEPAPYVGYTGQGIFKSTDGGATFGKIGGSTFDGLAISRVIVDGAAGALYAAAFFGTLGRGGVCSNTDFDAPGQGAYRSTDGGATWTLLKAGQITDLEVDTSVMPRRILISDFATGAFHSEDGGATWAAAAGLPTAQDTPKARRIELAVAPSNPEIVYAGYGLGSVAAVAVSTDGGMSFTPMAGAPDYCEAQCYYDNAVTVDPTDENVLWVGGSLCGVWKTENAQDAAPAWVNVSLPGQDCGMGDASWYNGYVHPDVHGITVDPKDPMTVYASSDGGIARSQDGGGTWARLNDGVATIQFYGICVDPQDPEVMYGGSQDNGTMMRGGASLTWRGLLAGDGGPCAVDATDPKLVLVSNESASVLRTTNGFKSIPEYVFEADASTCQKGAPGCGDRVSFIAPLAGDPGTSGTFYVGTYRVWQTTKGGTPSSWKAISGDLTAGPASQTCPEAASFKPFDDALTAITVAPSSPATIYTGSQAGWLFATSDGGATWSRIDKAPLPSRWLSSIVVDPRDPQTLFAGYSGFDVNTPGAPGHVFRSADGGMTWKPSDIGVDLPVNVLIGHPVASDSLYAGTDVGVLVTTDGGASWSALGDGLPHAPVFALAFHRAAGALVAATFGRSAWSLPFGPGALSATPAKLAFTTKLGAGKPAPQAIQIADTEIFGSIVSFTVTSDAPWLTVDKGSGDAAGPKPIVVNASVAPGTHEAGTLHGNVIITPAGGSAKITIPVSFVIAPRVVPTQPGGCGCRVEASGLDATAWPAICVGVALMRRRSRKRVSCRH